MMKEVESNYKILAQYSEELSFILHLIRTLFNKDGQKGSQF
jgi:hypothetical protein